MNAAYLGIDFGTSGARAIAINEGRDIISSVKVDFAPVTEQLAQTWQTTLNDLLLKLPVEVKKKLKAIAINGTSSTVLLCDAGGEPVTTPLLYNDARGKEALESIESIAPPDSVAVSATSSLAKLLWWQQQSYFNQARYLLHQADWLAFSLHGKLGISDYHNALKLGYDVANLCYPTWLQNLSCSDLYPQILSPGDVVGKVTADTCDRFDLPPDCIVRAGTTDSIAAFLASGATQPGEAVTSLGSTLAVKLLSKTQVNASEHGIYSHRMGKLWLAGGASNTGGAVLRHFFSDRELARLSRQIDPNLPTSLNYYPLLEPGERFPLNNPNLLPQLEPRPSSSVEFLQGLLEGIARIESLGYQKLQELGTDNLRCVYTAGGGATNSTWNKIRQNYLNVPVKPASYTQAAYGTALLAANQSFCI